MFSKARLDTLSDGIFGVGMALLILLAEDFSPRDSAELLRVFNREYANWWPLYHVLITCAPSTTIVVGRFGHFAPAVGSTPVTPC